MSQKAYQSLLVSFWQREVQAELAMSDGLSEEGENEEVLDRVRGTTDTSGSRLLLAKSTVGKLRSLFDCFSLGFETTKIKYNALSKRLSQTPPPLPPTVISIQNVPRQGDQRLMSPPNESPEVLHVLLLLKQSELRREG
ncbi:hypothetical protein K2173_009666 [Erythroxylum novogranatense]|uniref:Uncharacterized protein n=1 Tax=Erythroxylum novogranatense TaxID=1862640 RepID=A0AAV8U4P1_9ROSI|nr:hypothetical protein K2173_009666 [Erythroxylum novogranatense]